MENRNLTPGKSTRTSDDAKKVRVFDRFGKSARPDAGTPALVTSALTLLSRGFRTYFGSFLLWTAVRDTATPTRTAHRLSIGPAVIRLPVGAFDQLVKRSI
jgi:hypothetical protein